MDRAEARGSRAEGDIVADHAVVRDVAVVIGLEVPPDPDERVDHHEVADRRALAQLGGRIDDRGRSDDAGEPQSRAFRREAAAKRRVADRHADLVLRVQVGKADRLDSGIGLEGGVAGERLGTRVEPGRLDHLAPHSAGAIEDQPSRQFPSQS